MNWRRLNASAARLSLPPLPETLFLDGVFGVTALNEPFILSGMNFFAVVDGRLLTPLLTDSILAGITRDSVIHDAHCLQVRQ